jgi:hypothetical protein
MTRYVNALLVFLMVLSAAAVYDMKYEAELAAGTVTSLEQMIGAEQAEISLLKAEWSMLTQPARMQDLVNRYQEILQLEPLGANHIGTVADIPEKPVIDPEVEGTTGEELTETEQRSAQADPGDMAVGEDVGLVQ